MDHLRLLYDIGELNWIFGDGASTQAFLQRIVAILAAHMQAEVCSLTLYALAAMAIPEAEALARPVLAQTTTSAIGEILDAEAERLLGRRATDVKA